MAYFLSLILLLLVPVAHAEIWTGSGPSPAGYTDLAGWVKDGNGVSSRAFSHDSNGVRSAPTNSTISVTSRVNANTSKGLVPFDIVKTATVDTSRVGKAVGKLAVLGGPVGLTLGAVSLVCELTTICNDAGQWMFGETVTEVTELSCASVGSGTVTFESFGNYHKYKRVPSPSCGIPTPEGWGAVTFCSPSLTPSCSFGDDLIKENSGSPVPQVQERAPATADTFADNEALLNDDRFVPELVAKGADVPTGVPTLTADQKRQLGVDSEPTKDSSGNITGRKDTITSIEPVDMGTTDKPGLIMLKESKTTIIYDNSNTEISTSTSTSYTNQPQTATPEPPQYTITFDDVENVNLPTYSIPNTYNSISWGSGTCPADIDVSLTAMTVTIPTSPACGVAEMIHPFVLLFASITSIYIISGVGSRNA